MVSHDNLVWTAGAILEHIKETGFGAGGDQEQMLSYLPLSHVAAQLMDVVRQCATRPHVCARRRESCILRAHPAIPNPRLSRRRLKLPGITFPLTPFSTPTPRLFLISVQGGAPDDHGRGAAWG